MTKIFYLTVPQVNLLNDLRDLYESGDCQCNGKIQPEEICRRCRIWDKIGNTPEVIYKTTFNILDRGIAERK